MFKVCFATVAAAFAALAQPTDAQVRKDIVNAGVLELKFLGGAGTQAWNSDTKVFEYSREVSVVRQSDLPGVKLIVHGFAVYQLYGAQYKYWKFRVASNRYDGIPNPGPSDIDALIRPRLGHFFRGQASSIKSPIDGPRLATAPGWVWHTPNSVSFKMVATYDRQLNHGRIETVEQMFDVRLYRDDVGTPWKNFISTPDESRVLGTKTGTN